MYVAMIPTTRKEQVMKLKEIIQEKPKVKVGTDGGDGFLYCGVLTDAVCADIDVARVLLLAHRIEENTHSADWLKTRLSLKAYVSECARRAENAVRSAKDLSEDEKKELRAEFKPTAEGYELYLRNTKDKIERKENTAKNLATKLLRYTPVADREVKRRYDSIDEADTEIIIIAGYENGDFWTTNEYEEYVKQSNTWKDAR